MDENEIENIYLTMQGDFPNSPPEEQVVNLYADGNVCDILYGEMFDAKLRVMEKLGNMDEDSDLEEMIYVLTQIARVEAFEMFRYGWKLGRKEEQYNRNYMY